MDIHLHTHHNIKLSLELGYIDTVAEIKAKIQSHVGISTARQSLLLNNTHQLHDDWDIKRSNLFDRSHVHLIIRQPAPIVFTPDQHDVVLLVQLPLFKRFESIETGLKSRVSELKQKIGERMKTSADLLTMFLRGKELEDQSLIGECEGIDRDDAVVEVGFVGIGYNVDNAVIKVTVFLGPMNMNFPMDVNLRQSFSDVRKELERMKKENRISLPSDWFFVFGKQRVLIEFLPFEKFKVKDGAVFKVMTTMTLLQYQNQPNTSPDTIWLEDSSPIPSPRVRIMLKMPAPMTPISIEMSPSDTFSMLKDKIHELEHIPTNRISLHFSNKELPDQIPIRDFDGMEVGVSVKQSPTNSNSMGSEASQGSSRRMKIVVALATNMSKRIQVEVNVGDKVGELRKELTRLQERLGFNLPVDGYFFICKQNVMDDNKSFRWHGVGQGDTIEIFHGTVTGGN